MDTMEPWQEAVYTEKRRLTEEMLAQANRHTRLNHKPREVRVKVKRVRRAHA